jgi:hypothetical protein
MGATDRGTRVSGCFGTTRRQWRQVEIRLGLGVLREGLGPVVRLVVVPDDLIGVRTRHHCSFVVVVAAVTATSSSNKDVGPGGRGENPSSGADGSRGVLEGRC